MIFAGISYIFPCSKSYVMKSHFRIVAFHLLVMKSNRSLMKSHDHTFLS